MHHCLKSVRVKQLTHLPWIAKVPDNEPRPARHRSTVTSAQIVQNRDFVARVE
jgi:hypothetical protein